MSLLKAICLYFVVLDPVDTFGFAVAVASLAPGVAEGVAEGEATADAVGSTVAVGLAETSGETGFSTLLLSQMRYPAMTTKTKIIITIVTFLLIKSPPPGNRGILIHFDS